jgi:hypothetical protein
MQTKEKGKNTDSSKIQVTEPSSSNKNIVMERKY